MAAKGHKVVVCARKKEVTFELLREDNVEFHDLGRHRKGIWGRLKFTWQVVPRLRSIMQREDIDIVIGVSDMYGGMASRFSKTKAIAFTDTDHAKLINSVMKRFADKILTPVCCTSNFKAKQVRYDGYHELAYLHPHYFVPDRAILSELDLGNDEKFVVLRLVSWDATHDVGHNGIPLNTWCALVERLTPSFRIFISSERQLPPELEPYRIRIAPGRMHHVLAFAELFIGEGATMASECAVLGTPAIYVNALEVAYCTEQEEKYGLVFNFRNAEGVEEKAVALLSGTPKPDWHARRNRMLADKTDVTKFIIAFMETLCGAAVSNRSKDYAGEYQLDFT